MLLYNLFNALAEDAAATAETSPSLLSSIGFLNIIMLITSIYVLYGGIKGSGKLYDTSNIKEGREKEYCKLLRKAYIVLGALMLLNSVCGIAEDYIYPNRAVVPAHDLGVFSFYTATVAKVLQYTTWGVVILAFVLLILVMRKFTDKEAAAKKAQEAAEEAKKNRQYGHTLPVDAFEFDDDEEDGNDEPGCECKGNEQTDDTALTSSDSMEERNV